MARRGIETYLHAPCQPVVDMMPVVGSYIAGIDANVLDRIDQRKDLANLWPASHREQDLRARIDLRQRVNGSPKPAAWAIMSVEPTVP